jgi:hypothetical protein
MRLQQFRAVRRGSRWIQMTSPRIAGTTRGVLPCIVSIGIVSQVRE